MPRETNAEMSMVTTWQSDVYYLLPVCYVYIAARVGFSASECCYLIFFKYLTRAIPIRVLNQTDFLHFLDL